MKSVVALALIIGLVAASPVQQKPADVSATVVLTPVDVVEAGPSLNRKARQFFGGSNVDVFSQNVGYGGGGFGPYGGYGGFGPFGGGYGGGFQSTDVIVDQGFGGFGGFGWGR